ncbi:hypothetical protein [Pelomonas aquatica]|jgi:hypothetical protein|nr:hypothetical protein [Pelomonas aquatica]
MWLSTSAQRYLEGPVTDRKWAAAVAEVSQYWHLCPWQQELLEACADEGIAKAAWCVFREKALVWASNPISELDGKTIRELQRDAVIGKAVKGFLAEQRPLKLIIIKS